MTCSSEEEEKKHTHIRIEKAGGNVYNAEEARRRQPRMHNLWSMCHYGERQMVQKGVTYILAGGQEREREKVLCVSLAPKK